ncbi:alpha/beta hydrolase-fold protein [Streptomyces sp. NBC_01304]|uniref:alpha/beta hydrolase-fold protein n=1 Tax=Streptomyces sp. NBC_01304 TaxID=2903818 RepID=UPI002E15B867|nr:alpha/beta hydrolase-fold protein [Streptomyces sp. NBC_01304]
MQQVSWAAGPLDWSLVDGAVPVVLKILGCASLAFLVISRRRRWWTLWLPIGVVVTALLTILVKVIVNDWWKPFPDDLPTEIMFWIGILFLGLVLAVLRMPFLRWRGRAGALLAGLLTAVFAMNQANIFYDNYPTVRTMLGPQNTVSLKDATGTGKEGVVDVPEGKTLSEVWKAPAGMPGKGTVSKTAIPGTRSGFKAQDAYVYLPPAYQANPRPQLPVLVLMAGQPGAPENWITSGQLPDIMDSFAAQHQGLAPVVVVADQLGTPFKDPLCMDSRLGKIQTYLAEDVPAWITGHLQTATDRKQWAISGLSNGGTCSLQMAVNAPQRYGAFLDISGEAEPTNGSLQNTVKQTFGGDEAAYRKVNPLDVMARTKFPDTAGMFVAGTDDNPYRAQAHQVYEAAKKAGMQAQLMELPGNHSWQVWRPGFQNNVPWLARTMGLIR